MGDSDFSSQRNASLIVQHLSNAHSDFLKNLCEYHTYQTQLLVEIAKRIDRRIKSIVQFEDFTDALSEEMAQIKKLDRMLRGGPLAAWGQAEDSQDALGKIQWRLSRYEPETSGTVKERIMKAIKKDNEAIDEKVKKLIRDFQPPQPSMFGKLFGKLRRRTARSLEESVKMLLPNLDLPSNSSNQINRLSLFRPPTLAANLLELVKSMEDFVDLQLESTAIEGPPPPPPLLVLRKHTGQIVTAMAGVKDYDGVLDSYYPQLKRENDRPILYYSDQHQKHRDDFVASTAYIKEESMRLIPWTTGLSPGSDVYFIEGRNRLFALATVSDEIKNTEVIVQFPLRSWSVKKAIEELSKLCEEFGASQLWKQHERDYEIDRPRLSEHKHQLAVPGRPKKTALKWLAE
ncbi:hypothetical protein B0H14DRAFT_2937604 [Mycena olivaceomarginata]|nr:hypothetical protein B0H14DRAFT_2937604 [Mycena olivaceomarginata]